MTEPQKPGEGEPEPYTLPSWIDKAIARSKGDEDSASGSESVPFDDDDSVPEEPEYAAVAEAPAPSSPAWDPDDADTREMVPSFIGGGSDARSVEYPAVPETPLVVAEKEANAQSTAPEVDAEEAREPDRGALPWIVAALFLTAAALVLAYLIWLRPNPM